MTAHLSTVTVLAAFLVVSRTMAALLVLPDFGSAILPLRVRLALGLLLGVILWSYADVSRVVAPPTLPQLVGLVANESVIGILLGMSIGMAFHAVRFAGQLMGYQMGFALGSVLDPVSQEQVPFLGQLLFLVAILLYLALDGHHMGIRALAASFQTAPVGASIVTPAAFDHFFRLTSGIFTTAILVASPVIATLLLITVALGLAARLLPQMQIFFVAYPLKIGAGLWMIAVSMPFFSHLMQRLFHQAGLDVERLLLRISAGV